MTKEAKKKKLKKNWRQIQIFQTITKFIYQMIRKREGKKRNIKKINKWKSNWNRQAVDEFCKKK